VTIAAGYEGDVSPRPNGSSGTVTIADWVQTGRFAAGFDVAAAGSEFQRADTAPRSTLGNGAITISDWVQTGRYSSALDPVVPAGGPTGPGFAPAPSLSFTEPTEAAQARIVRVVNQVTQAGQQFTTFVEVDSQGNENGFGFSLTFDVAQLGFVSATLGPDGTGATLNVNTMQAADGRIGIALALPTGSSLAAGNARKLVALSFNVPANSTAGSIAVGFSDQPIVREIVNANADVLSATWSAGSVTVARAVASVSAASFLGGDLSAEEIVAAFGTGLATTTQVATTVPLPVDIAGTTVRIRDSNGVGRLAPLFFVAPTQVNYLVPAGTAAGAATVTITSGNGLVSVGTVNIVSVVPGLFSASASGQGIAAATILRIKSDGTQIFEPVGRFDAGLGQFVSIPIDLGPEGEQVFVLLFGTGFRSNSGLPVNVSIGGVSSEVLYAGPQGDFVGLDQANVRIPRSLAGKGDVSVSMMVGTKTSNTVTLNIK